MAELDEPPENRKKLGIDTGFHRSAVRPNNDRKESLLTRAFLNSPDSGTFRPELHPAADVGRRRSINSNTSTASSMELTSDGDLTSPARTNSPSPPFPATLNRNMASLNIGSKTDTQPFRPLVAQNHRESMIAATIVVHNVPAAPKVESTVETLTKKRCITFACGGQKPLQPKPSQPTKSVEERPVPTMSDNNTTPQRRACAIKFACPATVKQGIQAPQPAKVTESTRRQSTSRSPTTFRKPRPAQSPRLSHQTSPTLPRRTSLSPLFAKRKRPAFLTTSHSSEATRFHEFASEEVEEDDWIRGDASDNKKKITISDTLKKENAIRQLGKEAEEEALQEEEEEEEEEEDDENDLDEDEDEDEDDQPEDSDGEEVDDNSDDGTDGDHSDGNETDNEAGFAESDDESDGEEFQFWTPGISITHNSMGGSTRRASTHRTTSESSIESPRRMILPMPWSGADVQRRKPKSSRRPKIRPGTPDLPDSTDFVCGTLDEDRPLEEAYVSCMEVRRRERHRTIPQDIDPSFPTSDPDNDEEDEDDDYPQNDSDEPVWLHGNFEESDEHDHAFRLPRSRKSPLHSPKRLHSPPPPKARLRSPPPRRLFGGTSPRRMRSPPPARHVVSPTASPASHKPNGAITFAPLGQRPGLTHTKSLPRAPNAFCKQYRAARLATANANLADEETTDGYTRGAIDIVKGLERKRLHRKEKLLRKQHNNRARKGGPERKPQPGKGAERMRELGLHMAGKGGVGKAQYVLSI